MNIEIITTLNEDLKENDFGSLKSCNSVLESVTKMGHNTVVSLCETEDDLFNTVKRKPDLVILAVKHIITQEGETLYLSEFFLENEINFSGSLKETLMFDSNKVFAKSYLKDRGISTPRYFTAVPGEYKRDYDIPMNYPLFLKPIHCASDKDEVSIVNNYNEFEKQVLSLHTLHNAPVLVEEYLDGEDYTVSIIKTRSGDILVGAIEILAAEPEKNIFILNQDINKKNNKKLISIEDKVIMNRVKNIAIDAYIDFEVRDFGQIDIKTNRSGQCFFMKANLIPSMTHGKSRFLEAFRIELGLEYDEVVALIVDEGLSRCTK